MIVYDTVNALHWSVNIKAHFIATVIEELLDEDWSTKVRKARKGWMPWPGWWGSKGNGKDVERIEVPTPTSEEDCMECFNWEFGDFPADESSL
jgi:lipase ATG15